MSTARDEVLRRIRSALRDRRPGERPEDVPLIRDYQRAGTDARAELLERFVDRLVDYKAAVRRCPEAELAGTLAEALTARGAAAVVVPPGLPWELPGAVPDDGLTAADIDRLDGVVTACAVAVAETGTIVLDHGPGQGRRALTLVPDLHVCIVDVDQVVADVPDACAVLDPARPLTWVSGPSATSDIELDRVEGVHGPRTLHVIVVG